MIPFWEDYAAWSGFVLRRRKYSRHALLKEEQKFLDRVLAQADERRMHFDEGHEFVRARIGSDSEGEILTGSYKKIPYSFDQLKPSKNSRLIKDGRANPRGIRILYLADSVETAIAEVRPWISAYVTIGTLKLKKNITVVNLFNDLNPTFKVVDPIEAKVWKGINKSFSKPVNQGDEMWDYYATQYLAEAFSLKGYDGILYMSSQYIGGYNVVLFNPVKS